MTRHFGHVAGEPVGKPYRKREQLSKARVHGPPMGGIWGTPTEGASSIVLNGGYLDDEDHGDLILYTGHGGQRNGVQVEAQRLDDTGNAALVRSELDGLPVRVTRGYKGDPVYSPAAGFRYDGLFRVVDHWSKVGVEGFLMWQFRLEQVSDDEPAMTISDGATPPAGNANPRRRTGAVQRIVRTTAVSEWVKRRHQHTCQICGLRLESSSGDGYAEGAHIRPLGRPHSGPDVAENVLCLCPNHHVLLDKGGITIDADFTVRDRNGVVARTLRTARGHDIDAKFLKYHRDNWSGVRSFRHA